MTHNTQRNAAIVATLFLLAACTNGDDSGTQNGSPLQVGVVTCTDLDSDGYGEGCEAGADCNDADPTIHEYCPKAAPGTCSPSSAPQPCYAWPRVDTMKFECTEGFRHCVDGKWGPCELAAPRTTP